MYRAVRGRSIAAVIGAVVALVASANVGLAAQGPGSFRATGPYAVGNNPKDATVADLDGDGFDDVLTTVIYDNQVAVSRADGHGGLLPAVFYPMGDHPYPVTQGPGPVEVAVGDVTGDGIPDFVAACSNGTSAFLGVGNGDATFQPTVPIDIGTEQFDVKLADVDHDGDLDLLLATDHALTADPGHILVMRNDGHGGFVRGAALDANYPTSVTVADLDHDGNPDLAASNGGNNTVSLFRGDGSGGFTALPSLAVGIDPHSISARDLDGDGFVDVVVADDGDGDISLARGRGDGTFRPTERIAGARFPSDLAVADVNGDDYPDLVASPVFDKRVTVLHGSAGGTFGPAEDIQLDFNVVGLGVGDIDGDARPDVVAVDMYPNSIGVLLNTTADTEGPQIRTLAITPATTGAGKTVAVSAIAQEIGWSTVDRADVRVDGGAPQPLAVAANRARQTGVSGNIATAGLAVGTHTVCVQAADSLDNIGQPACSTLTISPPPDLTPPNTKFTSKNHGKIKDRTPTFRFISTEAGSHFSCRLDNGAWRSCTSPTTTTKLHRGKHTFWVRAIDATGNVDPTPSHDTFTVR
jgi:hypothetical protein